MVPVGATRGERVRRVQWPARGQMVGSAEDWFEGLSDEQKREFMGGANYAAYKDGKVTLGDFIGEREHEIFGKSYVQESLKNILGDDARQYYGR